MSEQIDRLGVVASSLCAAHCALSALLPTALSALGLGLLLSHEAEWVFTLIAAAGALGSAVLSWRRLRSPLVVICLLLGVLGLFASRLIEMGEAPHGHGAHHQHHAAQDHGDHHGAEHAPSVDHHSAHSGEGASTAVSAQADHNSAEGHESSTEHDESGHLLGLVVAILAGVFLVLGHISNIRLARQRHDECCT